jgi:manganese transport protein
MTIILQLLSIKLGLVTGLDLAQACKVFWPKYVNYILYILCEIAIIACDLADVIGSAMALKLLFSIPLPWGVAITTINVMILLLFYRGEDMRGAKILESMVMTLIGVVGICFIIELVYSKPDGKEVLKGFLPNIKIFSNSSELYITIGIIGATIMPHNLYLHSHLVKARKYREQSKLQKDKEIDKVKLIKNMIKLSIIDLIIALIIALFINASILIVSAKFYYNDHKVVANFFDTYELLKNFLGKAAAIIFALALLLSGQSSTLTTTLAGQIIMEGFIGIELTPWIRSLITRGFAILPAMLIAIIKGDIGLNQLLIASQVILSIYLPFAIIPLTYFTSKKKVMRIDITEEVEQDLEVKKEDFEEKYFYDFSNSIYLTIISCITCSLLLILNIYLIYYIIFDYEKISK